jgi:hypothetical protein
MGNVLPTLPLCEDKKNVEGKPNEKGFFDNLLKTPTASRAWYSPREQAWDKNVTVQEQASAAKDPFVYDREARDTLDTKAKKGAESMSLGQACTTKYSLPYIETSEQACFGAPLSPQPRQTEVDLLCQELNLVELSYVLQDEGFTDLAVLQKMAVQDYLRNELLQVGVKRGHAEKMHQHLINPQYMALMKARSAGEASAGVGHRTQPPRPPPHPPPAPAAPKPDKPKPESKEEESMTKFKRFLNKGIEVVRNNPSKSSFSMYKSETRVMQLNKDCTKVVLSYKNSTSNRVIITIGDISSLDKDAKHPMRLKIITKIDKKVNGLQFTSPAVCSFVAENLKAMTEEARQLKEAGHPRSSGA